MTSPIRNPKTVLLLIRTDELRDVMTSALPSSRCLVMAARDLPHAQHLSARLLPDAALVEADVLDRPALTWLQTVLPPDVPLSHSLAVLGAAQTGVGLADTLREAGARLIPTPARARDVAARVLEMLAPPAAEPRTAPVPSARPRERQFSAHNLFVDPAVCSIRVLQGGVWRTLDLAPRPHQILVALLGRHPRASTREELRTDVWGDDSVSLRSVDQQVRRLRASLELIGCRELVKTVSISGYRLDLHLLDARPHDHTGQMPAALSQNVHGPSLQ